MHTENTKKILKENLNLLYKERYLSHIQQNNLIDEIFFFCLRSLERKISIYMY